MEHNFSHIMPQFCGSIISTIILAIGIFSINVKLAIASLWVLPITLIIVYKSKNIQNYFNSKKKKSDLILSDGIYECIENIKEIKLLNAKDKYINNIETKIKSVENNAIVSELATAIFVIGSSLLLKLGIVTTIICGVKLMINSQINLITFFMFLIIVSRIYEPMNMTLINLASINAQDLVVNRMQEFSEENTQNGAYSVNIEKIDIEFKNVSFAYNQLDDNNYNIVNNETIKKKIINNISFIAKQNEVTALIGMSGSGKSTIAKLAARFYDVDSGMITLGNEDISKIDPETLLKYYSIVFQDVILFDNNILENIRVGRLNASDDEVLKAAHDANCDEFVEKLKDGYYTNIGENGKKLSGGERQRISIARAILKNAPIILLDEATASLDAESETKVQEAIMKLIKNKTVIVIAHRMRTVENANKIIKLKNGEIINI